jgi:tRNA (guanine10-N2)-dimethyltransferase
MKLLFELSGEHPELPFAELECVGEVVDRRTQVAVANCPEPKSTTRLALTHVVMQYLGECDASGEAFKNLLKDLGISTSKTFAGRVKKVYGTEIEESQMDLERLIGAYIDGKISLKSPEEEYRVICSGDRCYFGRVIRRIDRGNFAYRDPMRRPFFHPGVMMPIFARALVNLSLCRKGNLLFDPFCGTGGVLLEGYLIGMRVMGSDFDMAMVRGCHQNLPQADLILGDAASLPINDNLVDAVVTDLPYGQSVRIKARNLDRLYEASLEEMRRVLKYGKRGIVVTHCDITKIASRYFNVRQLHTQRVHKSLTRRIMVLD